MITVRRCREPELDRLATITAAALDRHDADASAVLQYADREGDVTAWLEATEAELIVADAKETIVGWAVIDTGAEPVVGAVFVDPVASAPAVRQRLLERLERIADRKGHSTLRVYTY